MSGLLVLKIKELALDPEVNPRFAVDQAVVEEYAETPASEFPPVRVYELPEGQLLLSDGFHRVGAARLRGEDEILADVRRGSYEEAVEHAFTANVRHGKQLTREEKTAAVLRLREMHPEWPQAQVAAALDLRPDRVKEIYQAQDVREQTGVHSLSQRRARAVANLPEVVAGERDARRIFAVTIETQNWGKDEAEAALRTLKDKEVDDDYKRELLHGRQPPLGRTADGVAVVLPETVARLAREDEKKDATGALYALLSTASALDLRLREAEFDSMNLADIRRNLDRLEAVKATLEQVRKKLEAKLRLSGVG
jgi:hypothetical protein